MNILGEVVDEAVKEIEEVLVEDLGVGATAAKILAGLVPNLAEWIEQAIGAGKDPGAQLKAMMDTAELGAEALAESKFGGSK